MVQGNEFISVTPKRICKGIGNQTWIFLFYMKHASMRKHDESLKYLNRGQRIIISRAKKHPVHFVER